MGRSRSSHRSVRNRQSTTKGVRDAHRGCSDPSLGQRLAEQHGPSPGHLVHDRGGVGPDGRGRRRRRRDPPAGLGPQLHRDGLQGGAGLSGPLRDPRRLPAESAGQARPRRYVAEPAGHARPALWVSSGSDAGLAGRWDARLVVGRRRAGRRADRHAGDGLAGAHRPDRRASSGPAADHRPPGRPGRHHHPEGRRRDGAHAGAHQAGAASQRGGQGDRRPGLLQRAVPVHEHAPVPAPDLRRVRTGAHVLGNRHHEDAVLLAAVRDDVHRGAALAVGAGQGARHGPGRVRLVGLERSRADLDRWPFPP